MIKMMTKGQDSLSEMAHARQSEGISVIFDQDLSNSSFPPQSRYRSRSRTSHVSSSSSSSVTSGSSRRPREAHRRRRRSSSSSSSTSSSPSRTSRPRSRSHPRCHRPSSRCRCGSHHRYANGDHSRRRSPPRRYRPRSRSASRWRSSSTSRSRSRSASQRRTYRRFVGRNRYRISRSPSPSRSFKSYRSRSGSRSSGHSAVSLSLKDKRELLRTAKANAAKILGVEQPEIPECEKAIPQEQPVEANSAPAEPEPEAWVRPERVPQRTPSQSSETESDEDVHTPKMSAQRKIISFSIHNSVAKPTVAAPSTAKVTPRMDSVESRKPYGHWVPVRKTGRTSLSRKHTPTTSC